MSSTVEDEMSEEERAAVRLVARTMLEQAARLLGEKAAVGHLAQGTVEDEDAWRMRGERRPEGFEIKLSQVPRVGVRKIRQCACLSRREPVRRPPW